MNHAVSSMNDVKNTEELELTNIHNWVQERVGGEVIRIERLMRWRPVWRIFERFS